MTLEQQLEAAAERGAARAVLAMLSNLPSPEPQPLLHTVESASKRLGVPVSRIRELVDARALTAMPREPNQKVLIPDLELLRYAQQFVLKTELVSLPS
jgi:hypothetical protein